jgi:hypothetical protein
MKIKILEYERHKAGKIKVQSHKKHKGKWKVNPKYELHKMLINNSFQYRVKNKKEYTKEV